MDFFSDMVYVFTPKGDVIELASGSIPIDFAYRIHTEIGNQTIGARINGKMEPLDYTLKNGDIVEVITSKHSYGPSQDWLKITQTSQAKSKIKQFFKRQRKEENVTKGKELVEKEIDDLGVSIPEALTQENIDRVVEKFNFNTEEDMYAAVGYQGITAAQIATRLTENIRKQKEKEQAISDTIDEVHSESHDRPKDDSRHDSGIRIDGIDNVLIRLSKCCNPVPGDAIVGYITKGRGVSVHRADCPNMQSDEAKSRQLDVHWKSERREHKQYLLDLEISGFDRNGLLNEILQTLTEMKTSINQVNGRSDR